MGNCFSRFKSSESMNPVSPPPQDVPPPPPPPPVDVPLESIGEMYKEKFNPELIERLISVIEAYLHKMNTQSEAGSSSSQDFLVPVGDATRLAAKAIDTISTEAEKLSEMGVVKAMGNQALKVMEGAGQLHWVFVGLSVAAYAIESYQKVGRTTVECEEMLLEIVKLAKDVKEFLVLMPGKEEKARDVVRTVVQGAVICCSYLNSGKFFRFLSATDTAQLAEIKKQLSDARISLDLAVDLQALKQLPMRGKLSPSNLLEFTPVGIEDQVEEVKGMLNMEGPQSALAVIICGFGGVGKSTLAASFVQSLNWSRMDFKFSRVAIDQTEQNRTSHIVKLQNDIIYDLNGVEFNLRDPDEGRREIRKALQNKCCLLFIDNVVDITYVEHLLPKDLSWTESDADNQKTKVRILITSRQKDVKVKLKIPCKVHEVRTLTEPASQRLLLETIVQGKAVEDKEFDENCMINKVAHECKGVPLLLSVFGEHLREERDENSYQEVLDVLRKGNLDIYRDEDLGTRLMHVYDKINDEEVREAFLDICTYFHGWEWNLVADIVDYNKLKDLHRRCLVSESGSGEVIVHDILRLMGMEKARLNRFSNLDNLEGFENVKDVKGVSLVKDDGLITIQSAQLESMSQSLRVLMLGDWVTVEGPPCQKAFSNLRYLSVGDITSFPFNDLSELNKLRVLRNRSKPGMSLFSLPSSLKRVSHELPAVECDKFGKLPFQKLISLKSFIVQTQKSVELPEEFHLPASLVDLNLSRCKNLPKFMGHLAALESVILDRSDLERLPQGFGNLKKLKHLSMNYCSKLVFLSEELGMLCSLEALSIKGCRNLKALPERLGELVSLQTFELSECIRLQELPNSFGKLRIQSLNLHSLDNLNKLPNTFGNMTALKDLSLESCHSLMSLPNSFVQLKKLEILKIIDCTKLSLLPEDFGQLRCLKSMTVKECQLLKELPHGFGALPALKTFTLRECNSFLNLPRDFGELTSLEKLELIDLLLMSTIPDGFGKLEKLRYLDVSDCSGLKTLSNDFENMAALERLKMVGCSQLEGAMMEKILKLPNCYCADFWRSSKLEEKWEQMQGKAEHPIVVHRGYDVESKEQERAVRVGVLHGKCVEVKNDQLTERSSLLDGLEDGTTLALIMLPINNHIQSHQHETLQRFVQMARESAKSKLQIVCARKVDLKAERATAREEEEEEEGIRQILLSLPEGSCAVPSSESKRRKILQSSFDWYGFYDDKLSFCMGNVGSDCGGRKIFENLKCIREHEISGNVVAEENVFVVPESESSEMKEAEDNSIQDLIKFICDRQRPEGKTSKFIEVLKANDIDSLLMGNDTGKVMVDDLHEKAIGFLICDSELFECIKLQQMKDIQQKDSNFIWIWVPTIFSKDCGHGSYTRLIQRTPWATFPHPQPIDIGISYHFIIVDEQEKIANYDALPLLLAWGAEAYPFTHHTIPQNLSLLESESCLEFLLHGMSIVGRKQMKSKMTFLYAQFPSYCVKQMESTFEELTQNHASFDVLHVGYPNSHCEVCSSSYSGNVKQEYGDAIQKMRWASLSFSDRVMFWYRCKHLASKRGDEIKEELKSVHGLAQQLWDGMTSSLVFLVDKDGVVTRGGYDVVRMISGSSEKTSDGEGMAMRMVKEELIKSFTTGECSPILKTLFKDEIHNLPHHPQHPTYLKERLPSFSSFFPCHVCGAEIDNRMYGSNRERSYTCVKCEWDMCGSCWMAYAKQKAQQLLAEKEI